MAELAVIVAARNEAERIGSTLAALRSAFPNAQLWVADDGSDDSTGAVAAQAGARVVSVEERLGKGGALSVAARAVLAEGDPCVLLADADLGASAARLVPLVARVCRSTHPYGGSDDKASADLAIATFARRAGGGFGVAVGASRWAIRRATGRTMDAPMSGQRALAPGVLSRLLPFAPGFGIETGMTIDALRAGLTVVEVELDLEHRATGKSLGGFVHRGRQARDALRAYASRRT
jgi:glycosyltransferase involved in cell wall biosynthesis